MWKTLRHLRGNLAASPNRIAFAWALLLIPPSKDDPPPLEWSILKYGFQAEGGSRCNAAFRESDARLLSLQGTAAPVGANIDAKASADLPSWANRVFSRPTRPSAPFPAFGSRCRRPAPASGS